MCPICHRFICASNCPNAPEELPSLVCFKCESPIYRGDRAYRLDDNIVMCEGCIYDAAFIVTDEEE